MISIVEKNFDNTIYSRCLELSEWRFSATAVGLIRFFNYHHIKYIIDGRKLYYRFEDIDLTKDDIQEKYLYFVESWFSELMHHVVILEFSEKSNLTDSEKSLINEKLLANSIMKKVFKGIRYENTSYGEIRKLIEDNKLVIILKTFLNSIHGYRKYATISCFGKKNQDCCRLLGYYVDLGRKTKSLGFNFNKTAATITDEVEFDFIPFAFSKGRESIFINNNTSISLLLETNDRVNDYFNNLIDKNVSWNSIFYRYLNSSRFIRQDTEIIMKKNETDYYETVFVRKAAINTFIELSKNNSIKHASNLDILLRKKIKINDNYYLNISELLTEHLLGGILLDDLIERIFKLEAIDKEGIRHRFVIAQLIIINTKMYKNCNKLEVDMDSEKYLKSAYVSAKVVNEHFKKMDLESKTNSYKQRLISCMIANDYDRFIKIMLQLSSYIQESFGFMHVLIKDFEANKNLAYEFINSLCDYKKAGLGNKNNENVEEKKNEK